jgi:hypothetical protein
MGEIKTSPRVQELLTDHNYFNKHSWNETEWNSIQELGCFFGLGQTIYDVDQEPPK